METTLPARYYTDPAVFARERERIFARRWVCAGREQDVAAPGDYVRREIAGESLILTRDAGGALRAFYNVCRHRGTQLCEADSGRFNGSIQCPYHAWTYGLDGRLVAAPHMDGAAGFDPSSISLAGARVESWEGLLFVTLDADAPPLLQELGGLVETFRPWGIGGLRRAYRVTYDVAANWKLLIQNYSECLHCPVIHPALNRLSHYLTGDNEPPTRAWLGGRMTLREGIATMSRDGRRRREPLPGLDEEQARHVYYYAVLPNLLLSAHPDYVMTHLLWPRACDRTEVWCEWHFHPRDAANPAFDPADAIDFWDETNRQDWHVSEQMQRGLGSRAYVPGPYSPREGLLAAFDRIIVSEIDD